MGREVFITRRERFSAAHRLFKEEWSDEKNLEVFGKCSNPNWHGHNYVLLVTAKGAVAAETGFVMDLKDLSDIIKNEVIEHLDHRNINVDTVFMKEQMASTENLCLAIWDQLEAPIAAAGAKLHYIKLEETENNYVEYYGG